MLKGLEFQGIARGVVEEHSVLLARKSGEANVGLNLKLYAMVP